MGKKHKQPKPPQPPPEGNAPQGSTPAGSSPHPAAPESNAPQSSAPQGNAPHPAAPEGAAPSPDTPPASAQTPDTPAVAAAAQAAAAPVPRSRFRRLLPDIIGATVALVVIGLGVAVWLKPPLIRSSTPYVSYTHGGRTFTDAALRRPLAMPTRFYVSLPEKVAGRYQWFTIDKRREVVALADGPPQHTFLGWPAVRRDAPLVGLDLEFRKLDGPESTWFIFFYPDAIVFSNNVLSVRLDTKKPGHGSP